MIPSHFVAIAPRVSLNDILGATDYWREQLYQKKVLVFRDLQLRAWEFVQVHHAFGRPWMKPLYELSHEVPIAVQGGECLTVYSNVIMQKSMGNGSLSYHRDIPFHRPIRYPIRSLYPTKLPSYPTSTSFIDADVLWDRLPPEQAALLPRYEQEIKHWYSDALDLAQVPHKLIPMVEEHPHTKRKSVLINAVGPWVQDVLLDGQRLGSQVARDLIAVADTPDNTYEHVWQLGDLVLFDNWSGVLHGRKALGGDEERAFWRINVKHYWQK